MNPTRAFAALGVAAALCAAAPAFADTMKSNSMMMASCKPAARFGGTNYCNNPKLTTTLSLVVAGGGPAKFSTVTLVQSLAGAKAGAEVASLQKKFGKATVAQFIKTFDFVIADSLKIVKAKNITLPSAPSPDPKNGKALSGALYMLGVDPKGGFSVEYMLDHLVSHGIHVQVMKDIDAKYGLAADAQYHVALTQVMNDLKAVYGL
jgi:hypothetical protein